jgi:hypothetical protein
MFPRQKTVLGNVPVVEIGDPDIQQDIQDHGEIKKGEIKPVTFGTHHVLDRPVYPQNPERFNQQVHENQQDQVGYKLVPQSPVLVILEAKNRYFGHTLYL